METSDGGDDTLHDGVDDEGEREVSSRLVAPDGPGTDQTQSLSDV